MPNHVHVLLTMIDIDKLIKERLNRHDNLLENESPFQLTKALQSIKRHTANYSNKLLNRKGSFWQSESYDHVVRGAKEMNNIINYILNNPVKAGLVKNWQDWKNTYLKDDLM